MKLSALSEQELSRWICEKLEPLVGDWVDSLDIEERWMTYALGDGPLPKSPNGVWLWFGRGSNWGWQPRPYTDPEIAMRLLKALLVQKSFLCFAGLNNVVLRCGNDRLASGPDIDALARVIAEGWAMSNGWTE